jgi:hypothetical protein
MLTRRCLFLAVSVLAFAACRRSPPPDEAIAVTVGHESITIADLKKALVEQRGNMLDSYDSFEKKMQFVELLMRNRLLAQEARRLSLAANAKEASRPESAIIRKAFADAGPAGGRAAITRLVSDLRAKSKVVIHEDTIRRLDVGLLAQQAKVPGKPGTPP